MVKVEHLTKKYNNFTAVDDLNFSIKENGIVGLLGPNGAGKSTTMRMLTGYLAPTSGSITVFGKDLRDNPIEARKNIGYLPEIPPLYTDLTVKEHLGFVCDLRDIPSEKKSAEIENVCRELNISDVSGRLINHLSKGYRQRVGFAAALIGSPKFLILDEPTVGLDPTQIREIRSLISGLSDRMSILISSHILSEISSVCDSLLIINRGRLLAKGSKEEIERSLKQSNTVELLVKGSRGTLLEAVKSAVPGGSVELADAGNGCWRCTVSCPSSRDYRQELFTAMADRKSSLSMLSMQSVDKSLEDIFFEVTGTGKE